MLSGCVRHFSISGPGARATSHPRTAAPAGALFSITFSLCSGDFDVSPASSEGRFAGWRRPLPFGVCVSRREGGASLPCPESQTLDGVSAPASSPTSLLSSSACRLFDSSPGGILDGPVGAVREPPLHARVAHTSRRSLSGCRRLFSVREAQTCQRTARLRHPGGTTSSVKNPSDACTSSLLFPPACRPAQI